MSRDGSLTNMAAQAVTFMLLDKMIDERESFNCL